MLGFIRWLQGPTVPPAVGFDWPGVWYVLSRWLWPYALGLGAGLSKAELARRLGMALNTVWGWESHGAQPRDPETRRQVAELLGCDPWPGLDAGQVGKG